MNETSEATFTATPFAGCSDACERIVIGLAMSAQLLNPELDASRRDSFVLALAALAEIAEA
jgi:hypothetical protein